MTRVSVVGVRGYAGSELLRLLSQHPAAEITGLYGRASGEAGRVEEALPHLGSCGVILPLDALTADTADVVFLSVPADAAQQIAPPLLKKGQRVVDLSGGHRLPRHLYPRWYDLEPGVLPPAVYGLTEFRRSEIGSADLVANPGCFATALLLGILPLAEAGLIDGDIQAVGYSGVSGAGRDSRFGGLPEMSESIQPYRPFTHQHTPEVEEAIRTLTQATVRLGFLPHVAPLVRGIMITLFVRAQAAPETLLEALTARYADEPFINVLSRGLPDVKRVRGTNRAEIAAVGDGEGQFAVYVAIDNLGKGAAGQAVQNLNAMLHLPETTGLEHVALWP